MYRNLNMLFIVLKQKREKCTRDVMNCARTLDRGRVLQQNKHVRVSNDGNGDKEGRAFQDKASIARIQPFVWLYNGLKNRFSLLNTHSSIVLTLRQLIQKCWKSMTKGQLFRDQWLCDETIYWNLNILYIALKGKGEKLARAAVDCAVRYLIEEECFSETSTSGYILQKVVWSLMCIRWKRQRPTHLVSIQVLALEVSRRALSRPCV